MIKRDRLLHQSKSHRSSVNFSVDSVLLLIIQHEELMKWLPSRITRTRIRVTVSGQITVKFGLKRKEI